MSKSDESDLTRINLLDDPKTITNKIKRAKTDAFEGLEAENLERPEARNLLAIYQLITGYSKVLPLCLPLHLFIFWLLISRYHKQSPLNYSNLSPSRAMLHGLCPRDTFHRGIA